MCGLVLSDQFAVKLKSLMVDLATKGQTEGIPVRAYRDPEFTKFRSLPQVEMERNYLNFVIYYEVCSEVLAEGGRLGDSKLVVWRMIKKLGLVPTEDLFSVLEDDDIIEIYDASGIQIFRNFNFFDISSYTLEELYSYPWSDLYERNQFVTKQINDYAIQIFTGQVDHTLPISVPKHNLEERFSLFKHTMEMEERYFSPLYTPDRSAVRAGVAVSKVRVIDSLEKRALSKINLNGVESDAR